MGKRGSSPTVREGSCLALFVYRNQVAAKCLWNRKSRETSSKNSTRLLKQTLINCGLLKRNADMSLIKTVSLKHSQATR